MITNGCVSQKQMQVDSCCSMNSTKQIANALFQRMFSLLSFYFYKTPVFYTFAPGIFKNI